MTISNDVRAWLFLVPLIPSIVVATFNLYHLLTNKALRLGLNNHVIILLLSFGLVETVTDIVWQIHFYRVGYAVSSTPQFCHAWVYLSSALYVSVYILMAWASIERHILVFYPNLFRGKIKRLCLHYIPLAACIIYPATFYFVMLFILPCSLGFNYTRRLCGRYSCIVIIPWISLWDSIGHYIVPAFITVFFSIALFARVIYRRYLARGEIDWRNYKKMTAQILPIAIIYMTLQFPPMLLYAAYSAGVPRTVATSYYSDANFFTYWVVLLTPFGSVASLPDLKTKCLKLLFWRKTSTVRPAVTETTRRNVNQPERTKIAVDNAAEPAAIKMVHQADDQTLGGTMVSRHIDQPVATLPDVQ